MDTNRNRKQEIEDIFKDLGIPPAIPQDYRSIEEFTKQIEKCSAPQEQSFVYTTSSLNEKREGF